MRDEEEEEDKGLRNLEANRREIIIVVVTGEKFLISKLMVIRVYYSLVVCGGLLGLKFMILLDNYHCQ